MTQAPLGEPAARPSAVWWARPRVVLPLVFVIAVLLALMSPATDAGDARVTTELRGPMNARLFTDVAQRMGWRVARIEEDVAAPAATGAVVHVILAPPLDVSETGAHKLLEAVRGGDALLLALANGRSALGESLHVRPLNRRGVLAPMADRSCTRRLDEMGAQLSSDGTSLLSVRFVRGAPRDLVEYGALVRDSSGVGHVAAGFSLGAGRVVVYADADPFRTDLFRHCRYGLDRLVVGTLEYLRAGAAQPRTLLRIDEYHQGFGEHTSLLAIMQRFLTGHPVGRFLLAAVGASLLLLLSRARRIMVPLEDLPETRRDPLEQADALARAYRAVTARRTAILRLIAGLRRRTSRQRWGRAYAGDEQFLEAMARQRPEHKDDITLVLQALARAADDEQLRAAAEAIRRLGPTTFSTR